MSLGNLMIQASAGSGKTHDLVGRYLRLLDTFEKPQSIVALTFTRKAAAEMRQRVLRYLDPDYHSDKEHEQAPLAKARAIDDKVAEWRLRENPQRLLIRTIDSFNHYLARTMPVASALGPAMLAAVKASFGSYGVGLQVLAFLPLGIFFVAPFTRNPQLAGRE